MALATAALMLSLLYLWGCGSEPVPEYRKRVTEILSKLHGDQSRGHSEAEKGHPAQKPENGYHDHSNHEHMAETLGIVIAELEEVRVPAGWEDFHRALLQALSSFLEGSHGKANGGYEHYDEHSSGHGKEGDSLHVKDRSEVR